MAIKDDMEDVQEAVINQLITDNGLDPLSITDGTVTLTKLGSDVDLGQVNDLAVTTAKIADDAVTTAKIADRAVGQAQIADGAVTASKLAMSFAPAQGSLSTGQLADDAVTRPKIADGAVTPAKLSQAYLPLTGGSLTGNVTFGDNDKAIFGAGSDLQIYHDGNHSHIDDTGTGFLVVATSRLQVNNAAKNAEMIVAVEGAQVELFHNNVKKIETTATGINVAGQATLTSGQLNFAGSISDPNGAAYIWRPADNTLAFGTANEERMRIDSSGRIKLSNVPTSASGLSTGTIYSDGGTLKIV